MMMIDSLERLEDVLKRRLKYPITVKCEFTPDFQPVTVHDVDDLQKAVFEAFDRSPTGRAYLFTVPTTLGDILNDLYVETGHHSSHTIRMRDPNYNRVLAFGDLATRYMLMKMAAGDCRDDIYFVLLRELTGQHPVPKAHWGFFDLMVDDWLQWGREHDMLEPLAIEIIDRKSDD